METRAIPDFNNQAKKFALGASNFAVIDRELYFIDPSNKTFSADRYKALITNKKNLCVAIPLTVGESILAESHCGVFSGVRRLYKNLVKQHCWPHMYSDVYHRCRSCLICASYNDSG